MSVIQTQVDPRTPEYAANAEQLAAAVKDLKAELARRGKAGVRAPVGANQPTLS